MLNLGIRTLPAAIALLTAQTLHAQQPVSNVAGIEEVVVTAQKRSESLQDTPIAITAYSDSDLENMGTFDLAGLAAASPSLTFAPYPSSSNTLIMFLRGQGANDVGQITREGAVGMYLDGIYMARPQSFTMDLADVERIEVLRGPQGTLYGRNTTGGAVNFISRKPSGEFGLKEHLTVGNDGLFRSLTTVDTPALGPVSGKISYLTRKIDGYVENTGPGNDYGEEEQDALRLALSWAASDSVHLDYAFDKGELDSTPIYYQNDWLVAPGYPSDPHKKSSRAADLPTSETDYEGHSLIISWEAGDTFTVKSLSGYSELDTVYYQDYLDAAFVASYYKSADDIGAHQWSQEFQFIGSAMDERLQYVGGLYYFEEKASHYQLLELLDLADNFDPGGFVDAPFNMQYKRDTDIETTSAAVYAQVTYTPAILEERFSLTLGGRYTEDDRKGVRGNSATIVDLNVDIPISSGVSNDEKYDSFDPMVVLSYQWTDELNTYAKLVTGYKSGGFSEGAADFTVTYGPEELTTYEVGMKSYWWDRRIRLNAAAFVSDYEDMQVDLSPDPQQIQVVNTYNAGSAGIDGIELEILIQPTESLQFSVDYTYLDWDVEEVLNPATGQDITAQFSLPYAPEHAYTVALDYAFSELGIGPIDLHLDYRWQDSSFMTAGTSTDPLIKSWWERRDYGLLNARLTWTVSAVQQGDLRVAVWANNLGDKEYEDHRFTAGAGSAVAYHRPQTYGLDLIYEY